MTKLGKLLVLANLAFSFMMLAWAIALYANRVDWTDRGQGELVARIDKIKQLQGSLPIAQAAWRDGRGNVARLEAQRPTDRVWYAAQLAHLRRTADATRPAQSVVYKDGVPVLDPANFNRPQLQNAAGTMNQPLLSLESYQRELQDTLASLATETARFQKAIQADVDETKKLIDRRQKLVEERVKLEELVKEQEVVRPQLINAFVESQLILRRADALKERIRELESVGVARGE